MNILLYSPDNGVTRNFMPHLWMFLLKTLTPVEHQVFLIDGNAQPMTEVAIGLQSLSKTRLTKGPLTPTKRAASVISCWQLLTLHQVDAFAFGKLELLKHKRGEAGSSRHGRHLDHLREAASSRG